MEGENEIESELKPSGGFWPAATRLCMGPAAGDDGGGSSAPAVDEGAAKDDGPPPQDLDDVPDSADDEVLSQEDSPEAAAAWQKGGKGAAAPAAAAGGATNTWDTQPLPAHLAQKFPNIKTMGELQAKYEASSSEVRNIQTERERIYNYALQLQQAYQQLKTGAGTAPAAAAAPAGGTGYFGFSDRAAYEAAHKADPIGTGQKVLRHQVLQDKELIASLRKEFGQDVEPIKQELEQRKYAEAEARWNYTWTDFIQKHPHFAEGQPGWQQLDNVWKQHPELRRMAERDPRAALEMSRRFVEAEVQGAVITATNKREEERRKASASARPGGGGKSVTSKPKNSQEQLMADLVAAGLDPDPELVAAAAAKFDEYDGK